MMIMKLMVVIINSDSHVTVCAAGNIVTAETALSVLAQNCTAACVLHFVVCLLGINMWDSGLE